VLGKQTENLRQHWMLLKKTKIMENSLPIYRKLLLLISCLGLNFTVATAQEKISLDEDWRFHFGNSSNPDKDFDYGNTLLFHKSNVYETTIVSPKFIDTAWSKVNVPHDWLVKLPFAQSTTHAMDSHGYKPVGATYPETSIGWYRKHFLVDKKDNAKRFELQFDGIYRNAEIWLNGFYVGTNFSGYLGNSYDVSDYINFEGDNTIVVRVDATQSEGWFYEGAGIYRHVWLNITDKLFIPEDGLYVHSDVNGKNAIVTIETTVQNNNLTSSSGSIFSYITDRNGKVLAKTSEQKIELGINKDFTVKQKVNLNNVQLWSLENPYLYKVISVVKSGNQIVHLSLIHI
jgi:beta-galactosidase